MALQELPISVSRLEPRHPLRHMIAMCRRAKRSLVRIYVIAAEYDSSFFSAILLASFFIVRVAYGPAPPPCAGKHEQNEVSLLGVKYLLLILQALQRLMM